MQSAVIFVHYFRTQVRFRHVLLASTLPVNCLWLVSGWCGWADASASKTRPWADVAWRSLVVDMIPHISVIQLTPPAMCFERSLCLLYWERSPHCTKASVGSIVPHGVMSRHRGYESYFTFPSLPSRNAKGN